VREFRIAAATSADMAVDLEREPSGRQYVRQTMTVPPIDRSVAPLMSWVA
jgi:hypothetical protein